MEERALRVLEFFPFLQTLKAYAATEVGQAVCLSLRPFRKKEEIESLLQEIVEASRVLEEEGNLPLPGTLEVRPLLPRARAEGACLLPEDLLAIRSTLGASSRVKHFLEKAPPRYPRLQSLGEEIPEFEDLQRKPPRRHRTAGRNPGFGQRRAVPSSPRDPADPRPDPHFSGGPLGTGKSAEDFPGANHHPAARTAMFWR